ncbi:MAG: hypothetical protein IKR04_03365 [Clostridia bacterium]|nr:hypothetical protein [Clostridia bacterium]
MKSFIIRVLVVVLFLGVFIWLINQAPDYDIEYKYNNGDLRVIVNDREITRETNRLPEMAIMHNGEVMLSHNTIDILFDKDLYFEEKYNTFITTSNDHRADIKIGADSITMDGVEVPIKTPAIKTEYDYSTDDRYAEKTNKKEIYYLPIEDLKDVYDINVEFNDKLIITTHDKDIKTFNTDINESVELKYLEDGASKTIETINPGSLIYVFNYDEEKAFNKARSSNGEIGYIDTNVIKGYNLEEFGKEKEKNNTERINIAWDSINPEAYSIGAKADRNKISKLDAVCPTLIYLKNADGDIHYYDNAVREYMSWAKSCNYDVWLTFKNESIGNNIMTIDILSEFLNDMNSRNNAIKKLVNTCVNYGAQGINVDFEHIYYKDRFAFSQFVRELSIEAHKNNLIASVCVNVPDGSEDWSLCYEHRNLAESADYICLMAYDMSSNTVSSFAPYNWVADNVEKLVNRDKVEANKILLGIDFGSALWTVKGDSKTRTVLFMTGAKKYLNGADWDEAAKQYYYESTNKNEYIWIEEKSSIKEKLTLIDDYDLGGSAFWCLGQETSDVWEALD